MQLSLEEITEELINDARPAGPDGCTNLERIQYVLTVFECESLNLMNDYDWGHVIYSDDAEMVEAAKHLALLKLDYLQRTYYHRHIDIDEFNVQSSVIILGIQRINWHLAHLEKGVLTPPFPSIH